MSIFNAIANAGSNAGAGISNYFANKHQLGRERMLDQEAQEDRAYAKDQNAFARQVQLDGIKRDALSEAAMLYAQDPQAARNHLDAVGAQWGFDPTDWQRVEPVLKARAASMPKDKPQVVAQGSALVDNSGRPIYERDPAPQRPFAPRPLVLALDDNGNKVWMTQEDAAGRVSGDAPKLTPAQEATDKKFANEYQEFVVSGGFSDVGKQISQLEDVLAYLEGSTDEEGNVTQSPAMAASGGVVGALPKWVRSRIGMSQGVDAQEMVEEVVQRNLRMILGAQFTEREGERLIARAYNPSLSEEVNARRVRNLMNQITDAANAKMQAAQYYEENGTLAGYKGRTTFSISDFDPESDARKGTIDRSGRDSLVDELVNRYAPKPE
jgi:hypothetical protein